MRIPIFDYNSYTILRPSIYSKKRSKLNFIQFLHLIILVQKLFHPIVNLVVQVCKMILSRQNDGWKMTQPCITLSSSSVRQLNFTEKKFRISLHATGYYACLSNELQYKHVFFAGRSKYVSFKVNIQYEMEVLLYFDLPKKCQSTRQSRKKNPYWLKMCLTHFSLKQHNQCIGTISSDLQTPDPILLS